MKTVYCPIIDRQIDGATCMEIVDVVDGLINERILNDIEEITAWDEEQKQKCLSCPYHADIG